LPSIRTYKERSEKALARLIVAAIIGGLIGAFAVWMGQGHSLKLVPGEMSYADLAATMLGAAGIILTTLGLVIGILALWGYSQFKNMVERSAIAHVTRSVADGDLKKLVTQTSVDYIKADLDAGELRKIFEERLDKILVQGPEDRASEEAKADDEFIEDPK
jgi:H+/Cl- antiporter ClcA